MGGKPEPSPMLWNFVGARREAGVAVVQAVVEGYGWRVGGVVDPFCHHWDTLGAEPERRPLGGTISSAKPEDSSSDTLLPPGSRNEEAQ